MPIVNTLQWALFVSHHAQYKGAIIGIINASYVHQSHFTNMICADIHIFVT